MIKEPDISDWVQGPADATAESGPVVSTMSKDALLLSRIILAQGEIAAAGLDVFEDEPQVHPALLELENVVLVPHLGSATVETRAAMAELAAKNAIAVAAGIEPPTPVRLPETSPGGPRC